MNETEAAALPLSYAMAAAGTVVLSLSIVLLIFRQSSPSLARVKAPNMKQAASNHHEAQRHSLEDPDRPRVRLLYGTQTGTAERFSKQLGGELRKRYGEAGTLVEVIDMENYKAKERLAREKLVVLCVATYGDGEPTDNAADFFTWLSKAAEEEGAEQTLKGVTFAVFGLGNKQYEHFNAMGKKTFSGLQSLGAVPLLERGDGDDDGCIDDDFDKWCTAFHAALEQRSDLVGDAGKQNGHGPTKASEIPAYGVKVLQPGSSEYQAEQPVLPFPEEGTGGDHHSPFWATVTAARELHSPASDRSCVHCELAVSGIQGGYAHGDHVAIHAQNGVAVVEEVAALLGQNPDSLITLSIPEGASGLDKPFPGPISLRSALAYFCDLHASPHKDALAALSSFATVPSEAARLLLLSSQEGKAEYANWIGRPHRSLVEVLQAFPSAKPSLGAFFATIAPRLQPRFYSISSSPVLHPEHVHVTCAVVKDTMPSGRVHEGVASTWLQRQLAAGPECKVPIFLRHSHFKLPSDPRLPVIMVGPGTGLAPFRGFIQEREALIKSGQSVGPGLMFFGCRNPEQDYIYKEELAAAKKSGVISELHVAFSRVGGEKDYVQHHLEKHADRVWQLLEDEKGSLFVCGDAKHMAKDVHRTLVALVMKCKGCSGTQAEAWVKALQDSGRYQRDVW